MAPKTKKAPKPTNKAGAETPVAPTPVTTMAQPEPEPVIQPNPDPVPPPEPVIPAKPIKGLTPAEEIIEVQKQIESLKARLWELEHPILEFPKMVKGHTFNSREEQDAAGPEFADKKADKK